MCPPVGKAHSSMSEERESMPVKFILYKFFFFSFIVPTFTCRSIHITQLVASAAVALVGAINVGTLLTAGIALTLIEV